MKTFVLSLCAICFGISFVKANEIPGGVIFKENGNAVFHSFDESSEVNITSQLNSQWWNSKDIFCCSENGKHLAWIHGNKVVLWGMFGDKPFLLKNWAVGKGATLTSGKDFLLDQKCKMEKVVLSKYGHNISFEFEKSQKSVYLAKIDPRFSIPELYLAKMDSCQTVGYCKITRENIAINPWICGNTAIAAKKYPHRVNPQNYEWFGGTKIMDALNEEARTPGLKVHLDFKSKPPYRGLHIDHCLAITEAEQIKKFSIKRNAKFACWSKDEKPEYQLLAFIYRTENGWGPIEIRGKSQVGEALRSSGKYVKSHFTEKELEVNPGVYEISCMLSDCQGMAFNQDGDLTLFSNGKIFLFNRKEIDDLIEKSGISPNPDGPGLCPVPRNNVFLMEPKEISSTSLKIDGSGFVWVKNKKGQEVLLYRDKDGYLMVFDPGNGMLKKSEYQKPVPEQWNYTEIPPVLKREASLYKQIK